MKEIKAYIKPHKLNAVTRGLQHVEGLTGMSVVDVKGFGRSRVGNHPDYIVDDRVDYIPHVKVEIVCADDLVERVVSVIVEAAHTGLRGDGKIYVTPVETAIRIETGERGETGV